MATFRSGELSIVYDDLRPGDEAGSAVALIHGFASNRTENWKRLGWYAAMERAGYRTLALDLRGHGESDKPHNAAAYGREAMGQDVIALLDHAGLQRANLVGYSMGAHVALALALAHPERIDRLVLGGIGGRVLGLGEARPAPALSLAEALLAPDPSTITDPIQRGFRQFAEVQGEDRAALAACASAPQGQPVTREALRRLDMPVLVVAGAHDELAGDPQALAEAIPGAKAVVLPGCDHFSAIPHALFRSAVFDFLDDFEEPPAWE